MKCINCSEEATFIAPKNYCDFHWVLWWNEGLDRTMPKKEFDKLIQDDLKEIRKKK